MSHLPIVIAGAGIAGLTLGRCLKHKKVPVLIVDRITSTPRYNYAITLHGWAYRPLLAILEMDESTFREKLAVDAHRGGNGAMSDNTMASGIDTNSGTFRCHRGRLEGLLREGQDIRWEHTIKDVETSAQKISVDILREESIEARLLIGADGVHSQVRKSLAPQVQLKVLPYVVFNGTRKISLEKYRETIQPKMRSDCIIQSRCDDVLLQISVSDFLADDVHISYTYSRPARQNDPLPKPDRPTTGATDIPEAFYEELGTIKDLGQAFVEMFDSNKVREDRVLHWLMRSTMGSEQDINGLVDRGVLLMGDSIHAMPILGGEGGNTAMKDGVDLAEHIATHGIQGIKGFTAERYHMWKQGVQQSEQRLAEMHALPKSVL